jgi:hypothetical protein
MRGYGEAFFWHRVKVPGGWFVVLDIDSFAFFYPDPNHEWDGGSLD